MVSTIGELDEMRARSMCARIGYSEERAGSIWRSFLPDVIAIREADERAGLVTVPREPTDGMWSIYRNNRGSNPTAVREIIAASPFAKKGIAR